MVMTHDESAAPTPRSSAISGRTVVTIVPSRPSTNAARAMVANRSLTAVLDSSICLLFNGGCA